MRQFKSKKGIEMSINIIVMLVIGLTILGLVIGFVTNLLNSASSGFDDKLSAAEDAERQVALDASGVFAVNPSSVTVNRGDVRRIFVKFKNTAAASDLTVTAISPGTITNQVNGTLVYGLTDILGTCSGSSGAEVKSAASIVSPGEEAVVPVNIIVPNECNAGDNFQVTLQTRLSDSIKTQFIEVNVGE